MKDHDLIVLVLIFGAILGVGALVYYYWPIVLLILVAVVVILCLSSISKEENRMAVSTYNIDGLSGSEFESCIADLVKRRGYSDVQITRATGDFGIDILCSKGGMKYGIQCKRYSKNVGVKAVQEAIGGRQYYQLNAVIVATNTYFTPSAIEMAKKGNVILWNRDEIIRMLKPY